MFGVDVLWHFYELFVVFIFFFKQKTAYEMRISDWSSDVCSSDLFPNHQSRITASMASIGVIDYGMGNLHSLGKALERVSESGRVVISYDPDELLKCDRLVLPGVGGVRECMKELQRLELNEMVVEAARNKQIGRAACRKRVCKYG